MTNEFQTVRNRTASCFKKQGSSVVCRLRGERLGLAFSTTFPHWFSLLLAFHLMCTERQRNWGEADSLSISRVNFNNALNFVSTLPHSLIIWCFNHGDKFGR